MTQIQTFQECRSVEGWQAVRIPSGSSDEIYTVLVNPWGYDDEHVCECKGYTYNGKCYHQGKAAEKVCRWRDGDEPRQAEQQRAKMVCPKCGGATRWSFEVDE